jgi:hypothetical protein
VLPADPATIEEIHCCVQRSDSRRRELSGGRLKLEQAARFPARLFQIDSGGRAVAGQRLQIETGQALGQHVQAGGLVEQTADRRLGLAFELQRKAARLQADLLGQLRNPFAGGGAGRTSGGTAQFAPQRDAAQQAALDGRLPGQAAPSGQRGSRPARLPFVPLVAYGAVQPAAPAVGQGERLQGRVPPATRRRPISPPCGALRRSDGGQGDTGQQRSVRKCSSFHRGQEKRAGLKPRIAADESKKPAEAGLPGAKRIRDAECAGSQTTGRAVGDDPEEDRIDSRGQTATVSSVCPIFVMPTRRTVQADRG